LLSYPAMYFVYKFYARTDIVPNVVSIMHIFQDKRFISHYFFFKFV